MDPISKLFAIERSSYCLYTNNQETKLNLCKLKSPEFEMHVLLYSLFHPSEEVSVLQEKLIPITEDNHR